MANSLEISELVPADRDEVVSLLERCLHHDGGLPTALQPAFFDGLFFSGPGCCYRNENGELVGAIGTTRKPGGEISATGLVDPESRGRGIGTALLTWARSVAGDAPLQLRSETLSNSVRAFCENAGMHQAFGEYIMRIDTTEIETPRLDPSLSVLPWDGSTTRHFFDAYEASFRERPGYPNWTYDAWVLAIEENDDFDPRASRVLFNVEGTPTAFIVICGSWIDLVGVEPRARRRGFGATMTLLGLLAIRERGDKTAWLNVEVNNSSAIAMYRNIGFVTNGERGFYE